MSKRLVIAVVGPADPRGVLRRLGFTGPVPEGIGGVPVNELTLSLVRLGYSVYLVTHSPSVGSVWRREYKSLTVIVVPSRVSARARAMDFFRQERIGIRDELRALHPDVIHAHWTYEFALGALGAKVAPVLVTVHDAPWTILRSFRDPYRLIRWLMAWRVRFSARSITAVSPYAAERWRQEMLYRGPIPVIPNPLPQMPSPSITRGSVPIVLSVGDGTALKNIRTLVRAFARIRETIPDAILHLVGPGLSSDGELADWVREERLWQGVEFLGPLDRDSLSDAYGSAWVYCHPSLEETFGMVLVEALSFGIPVIAGKDSGGAGWALFDGLGGRLVDVRNADEMAAAIREAIRNPAGTVREGFDVREALANRYSAESVAERYLEQYEHIADGF